MSHIPYYLKQLGELVSRAGMRYLSKYNVLSDSRRNQNVLKALKKAGFPMKKQSIDAELALVVRVARAGLNKYIEKYDRPELKRLVEKIQGDPRLPLWAAGLKGSALAELFWRLIEARGKWLACPAPESRYPQLSPIATEIDKFVKAIPGHYIWEWLEFQGAVLKEMEVMVYEEKEDEDEDEEDQHDINMSGLDAVVEEIAKGDAEMMDLS